MNYYNKVIVISIIFTLVGCANSYSKKDVSIWDVDPVPSFHITEIEDFTAVNTKFNITDQKVYKFVFLIEDTMRKRVQQGRKGEELFSGVQVLLAAFASAFAASTGVHPDVVVTLSGLSALTPEIANVLDAGTKAKAYSQALDMIEKAEAQYVNARAQLSSTENALIPSDRLTSEGAALFVTTISSLKVMRDSLLGTIPSVEELERALGKYAQFTLNTNIVNISKAKISLIDGGNLLTEQSQNLNVTELIVIKGGKLSVCSSSSPKIVKVDNCNGNSAISLTPLAIGESVVTVVSQAGLKTTIKVEIGS